MSETLESPESNRKYNMDILYFYFSSLVEYLQYIYGFDSMMMLLGEGLANWT